MVQIFHPSVPGLHDAIIEHCEATKAETFAFRNAPDDDANEEVTDAALDRQNTAFTALLAFDRAAIVADMQATGDLAYIRALALDQKRWLIMEAGYQDQHKHERCLLLDLILLDAEPFDSVPLLWHADGRPHDTRPSDDELQAGWDK